MLVSLVERLLLLGLNRAHSARLRKSVPATKDPDNDEVEIGDLFTDGLGEPGQSRTVTLSTAERRRHLYVLGATGCGKTTLIMRLLRADIQAGRSICVIDLRGDLIDRVMSLIVAYRDPEELAGKFLVLDLRDDDQIVGFNPLAGGGLPYSRALHVLSLLKGQADSWGVQLDETLRNGLIALAGSGWTLLELEPFLTNPDFRASVLGMCSDDYVRSFFARFDELSAERQLNWAMPVLNKVSPLLAVPRLRLMLGQREGFSLPDLIDRKPGSIILVGLAVDRLHGAAHLIGSLFVSAFQTAVMERVSVAEKQRIPLNLYVDEFETMASESFEAIVAEGRRFGLGLTLSHQNAHQIPANLRQVLRNNVHTQFYFQTGAGDAQDLSGEIGGDLSREELRQALMAQGVGEAFLVRRGSPSVQVKTRYSPDPNSSDLQRGQAVRPALARFARPRLDVERMLAARVEQIRNGSSPAERGLEVRDVQEQPRKRKSSSK